MAVCLFTNEGLPVRYETKWGDIHDDSTNVLLLLEERILEYREESEKLEQSADLYKSKVYEENFEREAARTTKELWEITSAITRNNASLEALQAIKAIMQNTEIAVGSFKRLVVSVSAAEESRLAADDKRGQYKSPEDEKVAPDFYSGLPNRPSPFLQQTVIRFEQQLGGYRQQVELLHQEVERMREKYLADLRLRGINNNPFLEADRREELQRQIEARRVHPTLHTLNPPSGEASGSGARPIPPQIQQLNSFVPGSFGIMLSGSAGPSAQPFGSPVYVSVTQMDGSLVDSNRIPGPAPLPILGPNNNAGAGVIPNQIPRSRPAPIRIPRGSNNAGARVTSNQISSQAPLQIPGPNNVAGAAELSPPGRRMTSKAARKRL